MTPLNVFNLLLSSGLIIFGAAMIADKDGPRTWFAFGLATGLVVGAVAISYLGGWRL